MSDRFIELHWGTVRKLYNTSRIAWIQDLGDGCRIWFSCQSDDYNVVTESYETVRELLR